MKFLRKFVVAAWCLYPCAIALSNPDHAAMTAAANEYAEAWLTNDPDTVMATFVTEPVLSPSGLPYVEGQRAAREFWFPADAPATKVTEFDLNAVQAEMSGNLGYVRGTFRLAFEYDGVAYENHGKYVSILKKSTDGSWRISHHFWDDFPRGE